MIIDSAYRVAQVEVTVGFAVFLERDRGLHGRPQHGAGDGFGFAHGAVPEVGFQDLVRRVRDLDRLAQLVEMALRRTWRAMSAPKFVIAAGQCAVGGGAFGESYACCGAVDKVLPVDVKIPGCPPSPEALLRGLLTALRAESPTVNSGRATSA